MAVHISASVRSRHLSRRDHVLNLLPPLTVVNKEDATMHQRLFADNTPQKNYPENFPSKVLRHLGAWTFYSAPTKGELALLDKNMYELGSETKNTSKTDAVNKQNSNIHTEQKTKKGTQSYSVDSDQRKLETNKGRNINAKTPRQIQAKKEELQGEKEAKVKEGKSSLASNSERKICSKSNPPQNAKHPISRSKNNCVINVNKVIKRRSSLKGAVAKQQKNTRDKSKQQTPIAKKEITLKKSRGKVLGGVETGAKISNEDLTIKGHKVKVSGPDKINKKVVGESQHVKEARRQHKGSMKSNVKERKDCTLSHSPSCNLYMPISSYRQTGVDKNDLDEKTKGKVNPQETEEKSKEHPVIKIPQQENESPEENKHTKTLSSHAKELNSNKVDSHETVEISGDVISCEVNPENLCSKTERDT